MPIILIVILVALLLIWGGVFALLKWVRPLEDKHFLALGGYVSVVSAALIFIVLQTALTQQKMPLKARKHVLTKNSTPLETNSANKPNALCRNSTKKPN